MPSNMKESELIDEGEDAQHQGLGAQSDDHVANAHGERGSRVLELVEVASHHRIGDSLKHQQKDETWDGQVDQIRNLRHAEISVAQKNKNPIAEYTDHTDVRRSKKAERLVSSAFMKREFLVLSGRVYPQQLQFLARQNRRARSNDGKRKANGNVSPAKGY